MKPVAEDLLADRISISSPNTLFDVVADLRDFIQKGLLKQTVGSCSVDEIVRGKPYPVDIINIEFVTIPGGSTYRLSCETYHGFGGVFKKLIP